MAMEHIPLFKKKLSNSFRSLQVHKSKGNSENVLHLSLLPVKKIRGGKTSDKNKETIESGTQRAMLINQVQRLDLTSIASQTSTQTNPIRQEISTHTKQSKTGEGERRGERERELMKMKREEDESGRARRPKKGKFTYRWQSTRRQTNNKQAQYD